MNTYEELLLITIFNFESPTSRGGLLAPDRTFPGPCHGMISESKRGYHCKHVGPWRRVIDRPPNDTGRNLPVSGEFNRMIAAAIKINPRWFFALGRSTAHHR